MGTRSNRKGRSSRATTFNRDSAIVPQTDGGCMSKRWTAEQDEILLENGHRGAEWCAAEIARTFHVRRSVDATRRHGNRIGVSWIAYEVCPECGKPMLKVPKQTGMCRDCNIRRLRDRAKRAYEQAEENQRRDGTGIAYRQDQREYDMYRQRKHRV